MSDPATPAPSPEIYRGKMSTFGGPEDRGVAADEGLALIQRKHLDEWWFARLFLPNNPSGTTGLARRLNPYAFYLAMRFDYTQHSPEEIRRAIFRLTNPRNSHSIFAQAADWGPNQRTKRIADLSPGAAKALALTTDDEVIVEIIPA